VASFTCGIFRLVAPGGDGEKMSSERRTPNSELHMAPAKQPGPNEFYPAPAPGVFPPGPPPPAGIPPSSPAPHQNAPPGPIGLPAQVAPPRPGPNVIPKYPGDTIKSKDGNTYVVLEKTVRRKGDTAWRGNNPGNLTADKTVPEAWSYGAYQGKTLFNRFVIFPTLDDGWNGLYQWMKKRENMTVRNYAEAHAPSKEPGNDPGRYARILVKHALGIQGEDKQNQAARSTTIKKLLEAGWPQKLKAAFNEAEGYTPGDELDYDDPALPPDVGPAVRAGRQLR
jgi:hypothetical protein